MHQRNRTKLAVALLTVAACTVLTSGCSSPDVIPPGETTCTNVMAELEQYREQTDLTFLDLRGTQLTPAQYEQLKSWLPRCEILWDVCIQDKFYGIETTQLSLDALTPEDIDAIGYLPKLERVYAYHCDDYPALTLLAERYPHLELTYYVPFGGKSLSNDTTSATIPGDCLEESAAMLPYLPNLTSLRLMGPLPDITQIQALQAAWPQLELSWVFSFRDIPLDSSVTTLDLTGIPTTVDEIEALLPYLPALTYLDMTDCGISNEEMDQLNRRHENVKIVWTVSIGPFIRVKTDTTWFMAAKYGYTVRTADVYNLRYCTDIIAVDLGHMNISNCDFVAFMPHLKYLILADTNVTDLTPLTGLKELVFLELFLMEIDDFAPLETLTGLEDLNIHYTRGNADVIARMTWLKNLWWQGCTWQEQQLLRESIPDCHFNFKSYSSTGEGWRNLPNYYAQRDIFGMRYLTG